MTGPHQEIARFEGFPPGAQATVVPSIFFAELLPQIEDERELRVTLYLFYALGRRRSYPHFVTGGELRSEGPLLASLGHGDEAALAGLERGLVLALERGSVIGIEVEEAGARDTLYTMNTPTNRRAFQQVRDGRIPLGRPLPPPAETATAKRDNVYQLYEANIGPLTPLVAQELKEAEQLYPFDWLEEALRESALQNKRSWRYAAAILQRWATEGRKRETPGRDTDGSSSARSQLLRRYRELGSD